MTSMIKYYTINKTNITTISNSSEKYTATKLFVTLSKIGPINRVIVPKQAKIL